METRQGPADAHDGGDNNAGRVATEHTPLIPTDLPPEVVPSKSLQHLLMAMTFLFLFVIEFAQYMQEAPTMAIMEDILCRKHYPDHIAYYVAKADDPRCKNPEVQKELAMIKGWVFSMEMVVPLIVQIPYGILADKIGRRPILFLSLLGVAIEVAWQMLVLCLPDIFPLWAMVPGALAYFIGGGGQMAGAMLWTMVADGSPAADRTRNFYLIQATILGMTVIFKPIAAFLMMSDPWINMWLSFIAVLLATVLTLFMPETLNLRKEADAMSLLDESVEDSASGPDDAEPKQGIYQATWTIIKDSVIHVWNFVFGSRTVVILLTCQVASYVVDRAFSAFILQYMTGRFDWSWTKAVYVSNINNITALVVLLGVLPLTSAILTRWGGFGPVSRDLFLSRYSILFTMVGTAMMAFSAVPWLFIVSLIVYSCGSGFSSLCRGLLVATIEPHTIATLNTTISTASSIAGLMMIPAFGWLLGRGMELGGVLAGLPFMVTFGSTVIITVLVFTWKIPAGLEPARDAESSEA